VFELLDKLARAEADFQCLVNDRNVSDTTLESAAGTGSLADGRSTPGDGTSNPGVNCTCCCN
jgi:hypothetical protein